MDPHRRVLISRIDKKLSKICPKFIFSKIVYRAMKHYKMRDKYILRIKVFDSHIGRIDRDIA